MSKSQPDILFLPKWYPHEQDPFDGNFIENHAHAIKRICDLKVAFVHSERKKPGQEDYRFEKNDNRGIIELKVYFKKAQFGSALINRIINFLRYQKAQKLAFEKLYPNQEKPDLIHVHVLARSAIFAYRLFRKFGIPYVITEHWSGYLPESGALKKSGKAFLYRFLGKRAKAIHTVSNHLALAMQSHGIENHFEVIPNVVDDSLFKIQNEQGKEKIQLLYIGNLLQHPKRILDIIKAMAELRELRNDFELHIYGEGKDEAKMLEKMNALELNDIIHFHGTTDRAGVANAMGKAHLLFLFSEFENQPCVISESLCCGTPIVVPDIEGIVEFMQEEYGILYPRLDRSALVASLDKLMSNINNYHREEISQKAKATFGEAAIAKKFAEFYTYSLDK